MKILKIHPVRRKIEVVNHYSMWKKVTSNREIPANEVALVICDMWNSSCFRCVRDRTEEFVPRIDRVVRYLRESGVVIIHEPTFTIDKFYRNTESWKRAKSIPKIGLPKPKETKIQPHPIDSLDSLKISSELDCDTGETEAGQAFNKQHEGIHIDHSTDFIMEDCSTMYSLMKHRSITLILLLGFHINKCILLNRIGIINMVKFGINVVLLRDLTDVAYNPRKIPYVDHDTALQLMIEYIEKFWCPTISSEELLL